MSQDGYICFEHISMTQEQHLLAKLFSKTKCRSGTTYVIYRPQHICEIFLVSTQTQGLAPVLPSCGSCHQSKYHSPAHLD